MRRAGLSEFGSDIRELSEINTCGSTSATYRECKAVFVTREGLGLYLLQTSKSMASQGFETDALHNIPQDDTIASPLVTMLITLSYITVSLRLWIRHWITNALGRDDAMIIATMVWLTLPMITEAYIR